jgi:hypothetical protein
LGNVEYDILGRIIYQLEPITGTVFEYTYTENDSRVVTITNENNKTNYKTIKKQIFINEEYVDTESAEIGETYSILKLYEFKNKEVYYERTNLKTGKVFTKKTFWKNERIYLWITEYDGKQKNIGFRMSKKLIKKIINKLWLKKEI